MIHREGTNAETWEVAGLATVAKVGFEPGKPGFRLFFFFSWRGLREGI